ncbi:hypothetical protein [Symbiobacterium thermophilum]|jgi:hypothetical protein|uniref:Uncharacterized protein n=1 Tax=Symbiobacterium thermophilum TaxID=2734 RepID=A0A953LKD1_SYMTR|nr:hypothetical protein [Symbiobacterium thermophilum]MBY6276847.1 hypothetical protein [Symbiobacterium thermophilum]
MPGNKIGKLKAGQGLRRILAQRRGGWRDAEAKSNFEVGSELEPGDGTPGRTGRAGRWGDPHR